ncbi:MAG: hypothetical protein A2464_00365 [Deltaproteobacteria bacterium RIFOXYC2_FULL_48_10]|nr:MAG: hypothetical protein A2464_00365 [Deltaproteobacteria bacterium RIFOXYC2_FULL_48_10]
MFILQEKIPLGKAEIRCNQRGSFLVAGVHQPEKQAHLNRFDFYVPQFILWQVECYAKLNVESL